ncbi:hypothetical protein CRUP_024118 [Coryphaenoides rupestris]|nr:hypothetical protein CRUP_024118 [Coryphaenoides rupestris]
MSALSSSSSSPVVSSSPTHDKEDDGSGEEEEESDVLSINADTGDIITPEKPVAEEEEEQPSAPLAETAPDARGEESAAVTATVAMVTNPPSPAKKELETDIDKSVSEILANSPPPGAAQQSPDLNPGPPPMPLPPSSCPTAPLGLPVEGVTGPDSGPQVCQPSLQQLELLELEMRARAIKALMKAADGKKPS